MALRQPWAGIIPSIATQVGRKSGLFSLALR